jgi:hypothetical protein
LRDDVAAPGLVAAVELAGLPADGAEDGGHRAAAVAAAPAVDQRLPVPRLAEKAFAQMAADVLGDQRGADLPGLERGDLLVERADLGALRVVEDRAVDGAGNVVFGKFGGGADVDDFVEAAEIGKG